MKLDKRRTMRLAKDSCVLVMIGRLGVLLSVFVFGMLAFAELQAPKAETDEQALQGMWKTVSAEEDGKVISDELKNLTLSFNKDTVTIKDMKSMVVATFKIDPKKKPKTIDIIQTVEPFGRKVYHYGIYELTGDSLKLCVSAEENEEKSRPTAFTAKAGEKQTLVLLERDKPDGKKQKQP